MIPELKTALIAKKCGMQNSLRIVREAKATGLPVSLAFAIVEQETRDGRNVWGGDPSPNGGTSLLHGRIVTKHDYLAYKARRGSTGHGGMQGVGPLQLTWYEFQDQADKLGGCWIPKHNLHVGFTHLATLIRVYGRYQGVRRYNGEGPAAAAYANQVVHVRMPKWHKRFTS